MYLLWWWELRDCYRWQEKDRDRVCLSTSPCRLCVFTPSFSKIKCFVVALLFSKPPLKSRGDFIVHCGALCSKQLNMGTPRVSSCCSGTTLCSGLGQSSLSWPLSSYRHRTLLSVVRHKLCLIAQPSPCCLPASRHQNAYLTPQHSADIPQLSWPNQHCSQFVRH